MKLGPLKIRTGASVGIYLGDASVAWCMLEKTPLGTRQLAAGEEPCVKQDWAVALDRVLMRAKMELGVTASVIIGLPASHSFFATLPAGTKNESAEMLLANAHCCTSIPPQDLSADMLPVKVNGKPFAAIGASRRKELQVLTDVPRKQGFRFIRVEPGPWALLRTATANKPGKVALRLLVDGPHMIAVLLCGQQPLLWRSMELSSEDGGGDGGADLIVSLVRSFESYANQHLGVSSVDAIVLEGPDTKALAARLSGDLGDRFSAVDGVAGPSAPATAKGLAVGGLQRDKPAPDLARPLAPPPALWDLVPRGEVAVLGAVVTCMGLWMWGVGTVVQNKARRAEEENARNAILKVEDAKLKDEKKNLGAQVQAVNNFLSNRVCWTEYLNEMSGRVPKGVTFVKLAGEYELQSNSEKNEKKPKKSLQMNFAAVVPPNLSAPPEVDQLMANIKSAPPVLRDFPVVTLSTLRVSKNNDPKKVSLGDPATFLVTCEPKGKEKPTPGGGGGAAPAAKDAAAAADGAKGH